MLSLLIAGGAIVNVLVAWVIATTVHPHTGEELQPTFSIESDSVTTVRGTSRFGTRSLRIARRPGPTDSFADERFRANLRKNGFGEVESDVIIPPWMLNHLEEPAVDTQSNLSSGAGIESNQVEMRGWPMHALWCQPKDPNADNPYFPTLQVTFTYRRHHIDAFELSERRWSAVNGLQPERVYPLRPIRRGFVVNTLFYAAILWVLFIGIPGGRRTVRAKRGRCPKCAYDLRAHSADEHAQCPECGVRLIHRVPSVRMPELESRA